MIQIYRFWLAFTKFPWLMIAYSFYPQMRDSERNNLNMTWFFQMSDFGHCWPILAPSAPNFCSKQTSKNCSVVVGDTEGWYPQICCPIWMASRRSAVRTGDLRSRYFTLFKALGVNRVFWCWYYLVVTWWIYGDFCCLRKFHDIGLIWHANIVKNQGYCLYVHHKVR